LKVLGLELQRFKTEKYIKVSGNLMIS